MTGPLNNGAVIYAGIDILIVEDSPTQALELQTLLEDQGCVVRVAGHGREALQRVAEAKPTIVISDIVMPEMDGYTLCKHLKSRDETRDIPVILVTTLSDPRDVVHGLACGADNFIVKPYDERYLLSRIKYFLVNMELRSHSRVQMGVAVVLEGEHHFITADRQQILDLLISTYEQGIRLNHELQLKHDQLSRTNTLLDSLFHFTAGLTTAKSVQDVVGAALERILAFPDVASTWLLLAEGCEPTAPVALAGAQGELTNLAHLSGCAQHCPCRHAWLNDGVQQAVNISGCPALTNHSLARVHASIPLVSGNEIIGMLNVLRRHGADWPPESLEALDSIGQQLAISLGRARLFEGLESLILERTKALRLEMEERERAESALRHNEALLRKVLETLPVGVWVADKEGTLIMHNPESARIWGEAREVGLADYGQYRAWWSDSGEALSAETWAMARALRLGEVTLNEVLDIEAFDGTRRTILNSAMPLTDDEGRIQGSIALNQDITLQRQQDLDLRLRDRAIESSVNAIVISDGQAPDQPIVYVNPAFERITGYRREEVIGRNARFLQGPDTDQAELDNIRRALAEQSDGEALLRNYRKDGSLFWNELKLAPVSDGRGKVSHFIGILNDVTEAKRYQDELEHQANHDSLTGLPNRNLLMDRIQQSITQSARRRENFALAILDLDQFKLVNDSLGHNTGDSLLTQMAERLRTCVRDVDTVARVGGDEFVILLTEIGSVEAIARILNGLRERLARPITLGEQELVVTPSIGFCLYPADGEDATTLLRNADTAMYQAKNQGRNRICAFTPAMNEEVQRRLSLDREMRLGYKQGEFLVYFQPQLDLRNARLCGFEALMRWNHAGGLISPAEFIPLAEETGFISLLDEFVLRQSCLQLQRWAAQDLAANITIAVNLSVVSFLEAGFLERVRAILAETGVDPRRIKLEVVESMLINDGDEALTRMRALKVLGFSLAIDDFGTGYSSLSYLKRFPFDQLKIDRSFITGVATELESAALTRSMISIGHNLGLKVIAEGVETAEQLSFLIGACCDEIQGYFYSPPLPVDSCLHLLRDDQAFGLPRRLVDEQERVLLLVGGELRVLDGWALELRGEGYRVLKADSASEALRLMALNPIGVVMTELELPDQSGLAFLHRVKGMYPDVMRAIAGTRPQIDLVLEAVNDGTLHRFLCAPWKADDLRRLLRELFQQHRYFPERLEQRA